MKASKPFFWRNEGWDKRREKCFRIVFVVSFLRCSSRIEELREVEWTDLVKVLKKVKIRNFKCLEINFKAFFWAFCRVLRVLRVVKQE